MEFPGKRSEETRFRFVHCETKRPRSCSGNGTRGPRHIRRLRTDAALGTLVSVRRSRLHGSFHTMPGPLHSGGTARRDELWREHQGTAPATCPETHPVALNCRSSNSCPVFSRTADLSPRHYATKILLSKHMVLPSLPRSRSLQGREGSCRRTVLRYLSLSSRSAAKK